MRDTRSRDPNEIGRAVYLGDIRSCVAGWHYHKASALPGERVYLIRELGNPYDANAIAVHNIHGHKIGYLPRQHAAILAPYIDDLAVILTGRLLDPGEVGYDEQLARTRPPLMIYVFSNPAVGSTIPAETAVTSG